MDSQQSIAETRDEFLSLMCDVGYDAWLDSNAPPMRGTCGDIARAGYEQALRDVIDRVEGRYYEEDHRAGTIQYADDEIRQFAAERGIDLEGK